MRISDVKDTLYRALEDAKKSGEHPCKSKALIDFVLDNTHLTYKYILVTALAAKATDASVNPLTLQAGSTLPGAYDARSVCHGVIVKFEMIELGKALGGSNEPYLNKPARFPELSKSNAVRRGSDQQILYALVDGLPEITSAEAAYDGLVYAFQKLLVVKAKKEALTSFDISALDSNAAKLYGFIDYLLFENFEGEILTLVIAGLYELYMGGIYDEYVVEVHPVNQSGASSKEVSDLDIYKSGSLFICNELKHKTFTDHDIRHAADKVLAAGKTQMHFIAGRSVYYDPRQIKSCLREYQAKGFLINVIPVDNFVPTLLSLIEDVDVDHYVKYILQTAIETKFKEETIAFIGNTAAKQFGV
ncbi:hypothetical protein FACS1894217_02060 [Clostridia bacterium]|nr:hypothetical protein FACS1894217_02060 [Clostridia bacterium]